MLRERRGGRKEDKTAGHARPVLNLRTDDRGVLGRPTICRWYFFRPAKRRPQLGRVPATTLYDLRSPVRTTLSASFLILQFHSVAIDVRRGPSPYLLSCILSRTARSPKPSGTKLNAIMSKQIRPRF